MSEEIKKLYAERLGRYQAAIALEPTDRIPIATGTNTFAETYSGNNNQETVYDPEKWLKAEERFIQGFPEVDVLRNNRFWAPLYDAVGCKTYKFPGWELKPTNQVQFVEDEYMKADEYKILIKNPFEFMMERFIPRVLGATAEKGSAGANMAFLKGGMAQMQMNQIMRHRSIYLQNECGMPQPMTGAFVAPFDVLGDVMRGLKGIMVDMFRQPDKVIAACDVIADEIVNFALSTADPLKRYPIFVPTHKACFISHKQFERFYWPSFKKDLEGDWGQHWHHFLELPKGTILCDIDEQGDIFKAKAEIGHHQCLAGGIPSSMFILGTPQEMRERVKMLCETVAKDGGFIINGGCHIPSETRPENYRAMIDAILEFGTYNKNLKMTPKPASRPASIRPAQQMVTPWDAKVLEMGEVQGDVNLIRRPWEMLETMSYNWLWQWVM